jgi:parvulin-like peptidyl-prolyl isomerase
MKAWLAEQVLSIEDFEAMIERQLLIQKLRTRFTDEQVAERFTACAGDYARVELRQIAVAREDLASELLSQLYDEGADFDELAKSHSGDSSTTPGSAPETRFRVHLPAEIAEAVFSASAGATVGPFAMPFGFCLIHVVKLLPACLDDATEGVIREQMFGEWLAEVLAGETFSLPLLESLQQLT